MTNDFDSISIGAPSVSYSDFSKIASRYDATRDVPASLLLACYDRLKHADLFPNEGRVLDAGCGTGQISVPLAERGYEVLGIDVSQEMIDIASSKIGPDSRAIYTVADVCNFPEASQSFDGMVVSKLFQHVRDWQGACRELVRVTKPGAPIVQINEKGLFRNSVRRYFSDKSDQLGFSGRFVGLDPQSKVTIADFMASLGCEVISVDMSDLKWDVQISYGEALSRIEDGLFAEFWYLPRAIHEQLVAETHSWIDQQPSGSQTIDHLTPCLVVEVFRVPAEGL